MNSMRYPMMDKQDFQTMIFTLWEAFDNMPNRIPLGDWWEWCL